VRGVEEGLCAHNLELRRVRARLGMETRFETFADQKATPRFSIGARNTPG